jgi:hypothetical protein
MDPFDGCDAKAVSQSAQECQQALEAKCAAECSIQVGAYGPDTLQGLRFEANGDCDLATHCAELTRETIAQGMTTGCHVSNCVRNGGTSCFAEDSGGPRTAN